MNLNNKQKVIIGITVTIMVCFIIYYFYSEKKEVEYEEIVYNKTNISSEEKEEEESTNILVVHITGAITNPGIIKIEEGSRIHDIIDAAGDLLDNADIENINLASKVIDGQKIYIPFEGEEKKNLDTNIKQNGIVEEIPEKISDKININTALQVHLETLDGIGPSTALKIIKYRTEKGKFKTIEEIKNVSGVGDAKYEKIKNNITVK